MPFIKGQELKVKVSIGKGTFEYIKVGFQFQLLLTFVRVYMEQWR